MNARAYFSVYISWSIAAVQYSLRKQAKREMEAGRSPRPHKEQKKKKKEKEKLEKWKGSLTWAAVDFFCACE
ncbi:MAG: hypothetical protein O7C59_04680 [Rickettsia endosymbiont of Ixodes persulcatus]|nr:hypothetical protein [Rickettsia endosymbiont of Ixodes persulcatus]